MSKLERYSNFRGGAITYVSGLAPSTVSTWGLQIGAREGEGHPRYDAADILAVSIMKELTVVAKVTAGRAAFVVQELQPKLRALVERVVEENAAAKEWKWGGGPYALIGGGYDCGPHQRVDVALLEDDELSSTLLEPVVGHFIVIPLRRHINSVLLQLEKLVEQDPSRRSAREAAV